MTLRTTIAKICAQEDVNFLLTNRVPRRALTLFMGWFSRIEQPLVRDLSIWLWRLFADLDLTEAKKSRFTSMHDCFIRELREGARPIHPDPDVLVSPCDAIVGASGAIEGTEVFQIKGFPYALSDLMCDPALAETYRDGTYVTLRLTAGMYHRFHAPADCRVRQVNYISGDTWNVNPIALKRVERLFCKNERAVIQLELDRARQPIALVPVAAILVASIRLHFIDVLLGLKHRGSSVWCCDAPFARGHEMGWFQHGSTIVVFAPAGFTLHDGISEGQTIRMGQPLLSMPAHRFVIDTPSVISGVAS